MTLTDTDLQRLIEGASEGPFEVLDEGDSIVVCGASRDDLADFHWNGAATVRQGWEEALANAKLFAAAKNQVPALLARAVKAETERDEFQARICDLEGQLNTAEAKIHDLKVQATSGLGVMAIQPHSDVPETKL